MKRRTAPLAEVDLASTGPQHATPLLTSPPGGPGPFVIQLPEGATVTVPSGFEFDEALALLTLVREALR